MSVGDMGEFGLIAAITRGLPEGPATLIGPGDDAALVTAPDGRVVATLDMLIEGRHFRRDWSSAADIGAKAAARNLADIAAMGASPAAVLVGVALPGDLPAAWAQQMMSGLAAECVRVGAGVAGGDISSADSVMIAVAALGDLNGRAPVTRSGARPGDVLAVAGTLGRAAAGLALLTAGRAGPPGLVEAYRRPDPPYEAGPEAAALGATSMIDVSDGLVADVGHVADSSGVSIEIETSLLDPGEDVRAAAGALGMPDPLRWLLTGGEDHALVATFPPGTALPPRWSVVGRARPGRGIRVDGETVAEQGGWDHFR